MNESDDEELLPYEPPSGRRLQDFDTRRRLRKPRRPWSVRQPDNMEFFLDVEGFWRRDSGMADPTRQGDGFFLDGVAAERWFASLDIPDDYPAELQVRVAELVTRAIRPDADESRVLMAMESVPPHTMMLFSRMNVYIRLSEIKRLKVSVVAGLLTALQTGNPPLAVGVTIALTLWDNIKQLDDAQVELLHTMLRLTNGRIYSKWLPTESILRALPADEEPQLLILLADLKSRGILEEGAGRWRAVL
jgi:hypothetical protein